MYTKGNPIGRGFKMYLLDTITYSSPVYADSGVLTGVDLHQAERTVRLVVGESEKALASVNISEGEKVVHLINDLLYYGTEYKDAIEERDIMIDGYKWLGEHTSDEDMKALNSEVDKYKPSYDTLTQLLGSVEKADKAIQQYYDRCNSGFGSFMPENVIEENLGQNDW